MLKEGILELCNIVGESISNLNSTQGKKRSKALYLATHEGGNFLVDKKKHWQELPFGKRTKATHPTKDV